MLNTLKTSGLAAVLGLTTTLATTLAPAPAKAGVDPFVGEMMYFAGNFCPRGWAEANGQLLAVSSNDALFSLLGTIYGGDGRTSFGLPDLRGRVPIHYGTGPGQPTYRIGQRGGAETHTLTVNEMASHNHDVNATNAQGNKKGPGDDYLADANTNDPGTDVLFYSDAAINRQMSTKMIANTGNNIPFSTVSPTNSIKACIALFGIYPSRN